MKEVIFNQDQMTSKIATLLVWARVSQGWLEASFSPLSVLATEQVPFLCRPKENPNEEDEGGWGICGLG